MKTLFPILDGVISQNYGENPEFYKKRFGLASHNGTDIYSFHGDKLYLCRKMFIYKTYDLNSGSVSKGFGLCGLTELEENDICYEYVYWHTMSNLQVKKGSWYEQGEICAYEGGSGIVYSGQVEVPDSQKGIPPYPGTHLHWGKRKVQRTKKGTGYFLHSIDGTLFVDSEGYSYEIIDYQNGNLGFIDPMVDEIIYYRDFFIVPLPPELPIQPTISEKINWLESIKVWLQKVLNWLKGR